ncbi:MAG: hypothetical protein JWQ35_2508 [Bacteriovoracaceae bacterium]|nr:hypothetical protein [Bacteriovoracaceae bacterium]
MPKKTSKTKLATTTPADPVETLIQQEVEEFLRDLTLEYPFPEIFEILRRHEFKDRFGKNVTPLPQKKFAGDSLKEIQDRIGVFLTELQKTFGTKYHSIIDQSFRFYTETTVEEED